MQYDDKPWRPRDYLKKPSDWRHASRHAIQINCCARCGGEAEPITFRDELSRKEYEITGLCQQCQDRIFEEAE